MTKIDKGSLCLITITALQFFIQGSWSMTLGIVLSSNGMGEHIRTVFFLLGVATVISPLFIGYISDKSASPKKIFSSLHFINAVNMIGLYFSFMYANELLIILLFFIAGVLFYPTTALISSLTFQNIRSDTIFPVIRASGTLGFMISGFLWVFIILKTAIYFIYLHQPFLLSCQSLH
ncbi:sugar phosphate permease [Pantoea alhagi]|nr:sugar phosphate permease [Pantoea alhagi]